MPETPEIPEELALARLAAIAVTGEAAETSGIYASGNSGEGRGGTNEETPMIDVHLPHGGLSTWRDFWIHLGTITLGLLIAISLEQTVEAVHHSFQRHQLERDLIAEAINNEHIIDRDLHMQDIESWFVQAQASASGAISRQTSFLLPPPPCVTGSVGTATIRYFAPSEAVWTAAQESGLVALLPPNQARLQARLAHNYVLLAENRAKVYDGCHAIIAMRRRLSRPGPNGSGDMWTVAPEQAEKLAALAAETEVAIQALDFRLRWSKVYEQGIANGESDEDINMMTMDQTRFEDSPNR